MKVVYINLDSRKDRRQKMHTQLLRYPSLVGHRISAVDKEMAKKSSHLLDLRSLNNLKSRSKTSHLDIDGWGAVGCSQSHLKSWKFILEQGWDSCWILEDDAIILRVEQVSVTEHKPFVFLGLRGNIQTSFGNPYPLLNYDRTQFGAHAYCVHKSILPLLIEHYNLFLSIDFYINELLSYYEVPVGYLPLCETNEDNSKSDVDHYAIKNTSINGSQSLFFYVIIILVLVLAILMTFK
jgi:hypothetical protein